MNTCEVDKPEAVWSLTDYRYAAKMTTRDVGQHLGLSHARVVQIEKDGTKDIDQIASLASLYGVTFEKIRAANAVVRSR